MPIVDVLSNGRELLHTKVLNVFHHNGLVKSQPRDSG